jgi:predicted transcriptional regulator of viral defense system
MGVCLWNGGTLDPASIWMAIDFKAKQPVVSGLRLRFVRFSGQALTQGVENIRIDGVPVRIYSAAKTIADCLKYRKKLRGNLAGKVLRESIARGKCSEQRLRHFAKICRVGKLVQAAYSLVASA